MSAAISGAGFYAHRTRIRCLENFHWWSIVEKINHNTNGLF
jgi:hypothetical protein